MSDSLTVLLLGFVLNAFVLAVTVTWKLANIRKEAADDLARVRREVGETMIAFREKIREVELFCRDTYMRRDAFSETTKAITSDMKTMGDKIEGRLDRLDAKIDRLGERNIRVDAPAGS